MTTTLIESQLSNDENHLWSRTSPQLRKFILVEGKAFYRKMGVMDEGGMNV